MADTTERMQEVEGLAKRLEIKATYFGADHDGDLCRQAAATIRALRSERDEARMRLDTARDVEEGLTRALANWKAEYERVTPKPFHPDCPHHGHLLADEGCECSDLFGDEEGVRTVTCDDCAFRYGAEHTNADGDYSCPLCELVQAEAALSRKDAALRGPNLERIIWEAMSICGPDDDPIPWETALEHEEEFGSLVPLTVRAAAKIRALASEPGHADE